jgi:hypothetical protein
MSTPTRYKDNDHGHSHIARRTQLTNPLTSVLMLINLPMTTLIRSLADVEYPVFIVIAAIRRDP